MAKQLKIKEYSVEKYGNILTVWMERKGVDGRFHSCSWSLPVIERQYDEQKKVWREIQLTRKQIIQKSLDSMKHYYQAN